MLSLTQPTEFAKWGAEALEMIRRDYALPKSALLSERPDKKHPAFNWAVGVMLSALNAAAKHDPKYKPWLREYADATRVYWNKGGYDVLPAPKPLDRYYDDNAWMVLALVETFEVLKDRKYLDWAKGALDFALKGEAKDGGIYWRESDRASRNTCSNGPTAAACLAVYRHLPDPKLLDKASQIVAWTRLHLEDPSDGLYWDSIANDGRKDETKWTYNSALMLSSMKDLKAEAVERLMASSKKRWLKSGRIADPGRFAHLILEAWVSIEGVRPDVTEAVRAVYESRKDGHYPAHWNKLQVAKNPEILDQAAFARACFFLANAVR